ncbi:TrkH family potassium uptake protein [Petrotoga olearia]|uniref:Cation transporter n=2 Tax=Petrotoga olearia TaxID=156203 RepID=A0A2K1NYF0_9BACT|nr:TrkH family potassium uptake protein [Petrotoga olearia]PNR95541.1 cation transporter [Petrotoga olearia DSM 13574]RMA71348.1 trk system potassium uptake protein TrkH [Petrotoga olearia]
MPSYKYFLKLRYKSIFRDTGNIIIGLSVLIMMVGSTAFIYDSFNDFIPFLITGIISILCGGIFWFIGRGEKRNELNTQDAVVTVFFVWTIAILLSALPFIFSGELNFSQAVFESTSGWTTTGLSMFSDVETLPRSILIWRSVMQFVGGAGFAIITVIVAGTMGVGIYQAEGRSHNLVPNLRESARIIIRIYLSWTLIGILLLVFVGKLSFFDAFNHTLTGLSTGGFSTRNSSIASFGSLRVEVIIMLLMIMGGTGFGVHYAGLLMIRNFIRNRRDYRSKRISLVELRERIKSEPFLKNPEIKTMFIILVISFLLIFLFTTLEMYGLVDGLVHSAFQSISTLTTTGFATVSFSKWNYFGLLIMTILMILGGMMDSTSGGLKLFRVYIALKLIINQIKEFFKPSGTTFYIEVYKGVSRKKIDLNSIKNVLVVFTMYFITYFIGVFILLAYGYPLHTALFEYASTLSTVGLSTGITSSQAPLGVIWTQTLGMYLGRLEFFVIINAIIKLFKDLREFF